MEKAVLKEHSAREAVEFVTRYRAENICCIIFCLMDDAVWSSPGEIHPCQ